MKINDSRLPLAGGTLVTAVATAGSLYLSLGLGLIPCELCWYQRILMYPLTMILGVATLENRSEVYRTALPLSILGTAIAAYHSYLQVAAVSTTCTIGSCGSIQYQVFGLTIPNLSFIAFVLVSLLLAGMVVATRRT